MTLTEALRLQAPDVAARRHLFAHAADNTELDEYGQPIDRGFAQALADTYAGVPRAKALELFAELIRLAGEFEDVRCDSRSDFIQFDYGEDRAAAWDRYDRLINEALEALVPAVYHVPLIREAPVVAADGTAVPS